MYATSTINDGIVDPEISPNRPLIDYTSDHNEDISV
jgi:hypothetical protein